MDFAERAGRNEKIFRGVNARIEQGAELHHVSTPLPFHCECANARCLSKIEILPAAYERVFHDPDRYVVVPGHQLTKVERVIEERDGYLVVEKFGEAAAAAHEG